MFKQDTLDWRNAFKAYLLRSFKANIKIKNEHFQPHSGARMSAELLTTNLTTAFVSKRLVHKLSFCSDFEPDYIL